MPANDVISVRNGQALIVSFNRPKNENALTNDLASQLFTILKNATTDRSVRAILLNGVGGNFMGGLDMDLFKWDLNTALERSNQIVAPYHNAIREIQAMEKPVIAAVEGRAFGPGLSFMLACDLVIAARSARFCCHQTSLALSPDGACSYFLSRKAGMNRAVELMMSSREFDAAEAEKLGLVTTIVDDDRLTPESMDLLAKMADGPTRAYGAVKKLALRAFEQDLNGQLGLEHTYLGACLRSFDFRDFLRARASNSPTKYTGT